MAHVTWDLRPSSFYPSGYVNLALKSVARVTENLHFFLPRSNGVLIVIEGIFDSPSIAPMGL